MSTPVYIKPLTIKEKIDERIARFEEPIIQQENKDFMDSLIMNDMTWEVLPNNTNARILHEPSGMSLTIEYNEKTSTAYKVYTMNKLKTLIKSTYS